MTVGTRSVLYGAHCFFIHPWFVAWAWWQLYGFPWDPRLWFAFFLHDIGYIGKPNMDGPEGERHPIVGAILMRDLFDWTRTDRVVGMTGDVVDGAEEFGYWGMFTLLHSRYFSKRLGVAPSRLCVADKLATYLTPAWLYLPMVRATGEIDEYRAHAVHRVKGNERLSQAERDQLLGDERSWFVGVQGYCARWAWAHRDDQYDTWTQDPGQRAVQDPSGTWR
jgi:hypothetical protein